MPDSARRPGGAADRSRDWARLRNAARRRRGRRGATLADIAVAAGVSVTTASNVAVGRLEMMSAATRQRVESALRRLVHRPDEGARSLRLAQKRTIGLIVVDDSPRFLANPMNTNIVAGSLTPLT